MFSLLSSFLRVSPVPEFCPGGVCFQSRFASCFPIVGEVVWTIVLFYLAPLIPLHPLRVRDRAPFVKLPQPFSGWAVFNLFDGVTWSPHQPSNLSSLSVQKTVVFLLLIDQNPEPCLTPLPDLLDYSPLRCPHDSFARRPPLSSFPGMFFTPHPPPQGFVWFSSFFHARPNCPSPLIPFCRELLLHPR